MKNSLQDLYGNIDIYLFDQLLKGTYNQCTSVLDVGCGGGRNLIYFLKNGCEVFGIDPNADAVESVKRLSAEHAPNNSLEHFKQGIAENIPFTSRFDLVICSAVLHFAKDRGQFEDMLNSMWAVLKPEGYFFARLASDIGIETLVQHLGNSRYLLPDGSERFLVNQQMLLQYTEQLGGYLHEPIKTTNVQNLRCMTTWCLRK